MRTASLTSVAAVCLLGAGVAWVFISAWEPRAVRQDIALAHVQLDRRLAADHAEAEEVLAALRRRIWNPARDGNLRRATIDIAVKQNEKRGRYRASFDGAKPLDGQITVEVLEEENGIDPRSAGRVKQIADVAFLGAYQEVMNPLPAVRYALQRDPAGNRIVVTPAFRLAPQTSYKFGRRGLVEVTGELLPKDATRIVRFVWLDWETGAVLQGTSEDLAGERGVAESSYAYAHGDGFPALRRVIVRRKSASAGPAGDRFEATLEWSAVVKQ